MTEMNGRGRAAALRPARPRLHRKKGPVRLGEPCGPLALASVAKTEMVVAVLPGIGAGPTCHGAVQADTVVATIGCEFAWFHNPFLPTRG